MKKSELFACLHSIIHAEGLESHFPLDVLVELAKLDAARPAPPAQLHLAGLETAWPRTIEDIEEAYDFEAGIPGILFPYDPGTHVSEDGRVFIARLDQGHLFTSDAAAADFMALLIGVPWQRFYDQPGERWFYPYFEITLKQAEMTHALYGREK